MNLTRDLLLTYQGLNGFDGLCHVRIYEQPGQLPIVIVGALDDNPGTSITNAISMVAAAVQRRAFSDGREFRLIEHYPDTIDGRGTPTYALVHFEHRAIHESPDDPRNHAGSIVVLGQGLDEEVTASRGAQIEGDFRDPRWEPIERIDELVGCEITVWPSGSYTARAMAGEQGERLRVELAEHVHRTCDKIMAAIGEGG
jgi:hypothetical protein